MDGVETGGYAFIPLFPEPYASESQAQIAEAIDPEGGQPAACLRPPIAGLEFIAANGQLSEMLDAWWEEAVPPGMLPVLLMLHEPGLETWVRGLDAELVIGMSRRDDLGSYRQFPNVRAELTDDPRLVTHVAMREYPECFRRQVPAPEPESPPVHIRVPNPLAPPGLRPLAAGGRKSGDGMLDELRALALAFEPGKIVGVTSRAGGVGKTGIAAGLGIVYGEAVEGSSWCAAVVDQNIGNPDQWSRLQLPSQTRTVFEIMGDIESGREWTVPAWSRTPSLAVYPERRDVGDGYAPGQIDRFASQLRRLHMISIVDLPNRLPELTSGEAAVCAGWIAVADAIVLPTTEDPTRLRGVLEYLDLPTMAGMPTIIAYLRSPAREVSQHPRVRATLQQIRQRALAVVELPKDDRATLALVQGTPITAADPTLRRAFIDLALTVGRALVA